MSGFVAKVILYHTTAFGSTEHATRSVDRAQAAARRVRAWLDSSAAPRPSALVLTGPAAVAWACGGIAPPVDRTAAVDLSWAVFTASGTALITTCVEADRISAEYDPAAHGFAELVSVPWQDPAAFVTAAQELAGGPAASIAADGHPAFGLDASQDLIALRLALSGPERADLADLGLDAAAALQSALASFRPGERDLDIQARCAAHLEATGADTPVLIVGGDERLVRYRHPMAAGVPVHRLVMAVVVARRAGLHVAATRFASAGPLDPAYRDLRRRVLAIDDAVLSACRPGRPLRRRAAGAGCRVRAQRRARGVGRSLPGRTDRLRAARVRAGARPDRCPLVQRADRGRSRGRLEPQPARRREGGGHLPGDRRWRAHASDQRAGLAGGT